MVVRRLVPPMVAVEPQGALRSIFSTNTGHLQRIRTFMLSTRLPAYTVVYRLVSGTWPLRSVGTACLANASAARPGNSRQRRASAKPGVRRSGNPGRRTGWPGPCTAPRLVLPTTGGCGRNAVTRAIAPRGSCSETGLTCENLRFSNTRRSLSLTIRIPGGRPRLH